jgi:hypothetical protein
MYSKIGPIKSTDDDEESNYFWDMDAKSSTDDDDDDLDDLLSILKKRVSPKKPSKPEPSLDEDDDEDFLEKLRSSKNDYISEKKKTITSRLNSSFDLLITNLTIKDVQIDLNIGRLKNISCNRLTTGYDITVEIITADTYDGDFNTFAINFSTYNRDVTFEHDSENLIPQGFDLNGSAFRLFKSRMNDVFKILEDYYEMPIREISDGAVGYLCAESDELWEC